MKISWEAKQFGIKQKRIKVNKVNWRDLQVSVLVLELKFQLKSFCLFLSNSKTIKTNQTIEGNCAVIVVVVIFFSLLLHNVFLTRNVNNFFCLAFSSQQLCSPWFKAQQILSLRFFAFPQEILEIKFVSERERKIRAESV